MALCKVWFGRLNPFAVERTLTSEYMIQVHIQIGTTVYIYYMSSHTKTEIIKTFKIHADFKENTHTHTCTNLSSLLAVMATRLHHDATHRGCKNNVRSRF